MRKINLGIKFLIKLNYLFIIHIVYINDLIYNIFKITKITVYQMMI